MLTQKQFALCWKLGLRFTEAHWRLVGTTDNINELLTKVGTLQNTVETLTDNADELK